MTHRRTAAAITAAAVGAAALTALPSAAVAAEPTTDGLVAHYPLEGTGTTVADASGNGLDATVVGGAELGPDGVVLDGVDDYVDLPDDLMAGLDAITVAFDVLIHPDLTGNYMIYGLGNTTDWYGDGYLFSEGNPLRTAIASGNWTTEQNLEATPPSNAPRGVWTHVAYTLAPDGTAVLYQDGVEIARRTGVTVTPGSIGDGVTTANYIGRSVYTPDPYFEGAVHDFRIYDRALTEAEIDDIVLANVDGELAADVAAFGIGDTSAVTSDLTLPTRTEGGSAVAWASSDEGVVTAAGVVTRPAAGEPAATATLTATLTQRGGTATKEFTVTVLPLETDQTRADAAAAALVVTNVDDVRGNLHLPTTVEGGTVSWTTSDASIITATGEVDRPAHGDDAATVVLTATVTIGSATATRTFTATVPALPAPLDYEGYFFPYFKGETDTTFEEVYFSLSEGNDPLEWQPLNDGESVLQSDVGDEGVRDPFILRSPEGDKFYLIATDLNMHDKYGQYDFGSAQETGSQNIIVWESTDLVNWTDERAVEVSSDFAGNTWAPEAFYDAEAGHYVVYWASNLYPTTDESNRDVTTTYNRMMYATTRDFVTFSEPQPWIDVQRGPGRGMIDVTVIQDGDLFYRFVKDEASMTIRQERSPELDAVVTGTLPTTTSEPWQLVKERVAAGQPNPWGGTFEQGEGPLVFRDNEDPSHVYLFIDQPSYHGGQGYVAFETHDLSSGTWTSIPSADLPSSPRHGTVLPVTQDEYDALLAAYQADAFVESAAPVAVTTTVGTAPELPATVTVTYGDGSTGELPVTWDPVAPEQYAVAGEFEVVGHLGDGVSTQAVAVVTVEAGWVPPIFVDVSEGHPFYEDIRWLADTGLSEGTEVGDETYFLPTAAMSRQAMAAFLYRYAGDGWTPEAGTQSFTDVAPGHPFYVAVEWMAEVGLAEGYADGSFGATRPVSRQATAAFLHRLAGEPEAMEPAAFTDVHAGHPFATAIAWLQEAEITDGYDDGSFGTTRPVTRQAMAAFLHRFDQFLFRADTVAQD